MLAENRSERFYHGTIEQLHLLYELTEMVETKELSWGKKQIEVEKFLIQKKF